MTSDDVVKALRKSASSLKEVADKLAAIPLSVRNYDLPDAFWGVAHTQFYALEDSIYWLELRYHDSTSIRNIRDRLSRLAGAEDAFFGADYEKANIDYIRKCQSFREEQIRLAKELEAIADYVEEKAATDSDRLSKVHYGSGAATDGVIAHPPTAQEPQTDGGGPTNDPRRYWTVKTCPECGAPGLTYISKSEFSELGGPARNTISKWMYNGTYLADRAGKLPWCETCRERTPLGAGVVGRPEAPPANDYKLTEADKNTLEAWALAMTRKELKRKRSIADADAWEPSRTSTAEDGRGLETYNLIFTAMAEHLKASRGDAQRSQCQDAAQSAVKAHYNDRDKSLDAVKHSDGLDSLNEHGQVHRDGNARRSPGQRGKRPDTEE
jgi:hypothetical protein